MDWTLLPMEAVQVGVIVLVRDPFLPAWLIIL